MTTNTVTIDRELFEWLVEYAIMLRGVSNAHHENDAWPELTAHVKQAVAIRDGVQKEGKE